jgi:hypothetical protein
MRARFVLDISASNFIHERRLWYANIPHTLYVVLHLKMARIKNENIELKELSRILNSMSENLKNDFERFKTKRKKKPNLDFHETEWKYLIEAGGVLWLLFDNYFGQLDKKLQNIIGDWKSERNSSYNPNWAKGKTFENVCIKWIDNFDWTLKSNGTTYSYATGMKTIAEYIDGIKT